MQKADLLIHTKLKLPFTRPELVLRPRLQEQITQGLRGPLTLITAPAGFGKTTLVASCVVNCGLQVAWLSLDKSDNQTGRFLCYLVAALQETNEAIGYEAAQQLAASQLTSDEMILTSLVNDLDKVNSDIALVLDDYQLISSQVVHEDVSFLLNHCPKAFHLVLITRSDPPLPLFRLRACGQAVELRAADLRFTESEAIQFLNDIMGLRLDTGSVAVLEERTEGWIAGLQMAALSMRGRGDVENFIQEFAGTNRFIMDFMLEQVLAHEPEDVQAFLLQTAILNRLTGSLCDAVTCTSGGQEMLERLEKQNLFIVPLDDNRHWYRYHHLFADLLRARLYQSGSDGVANLLSRAAVWSEQDGQITEAVGYALAAQNYEQASGQIARYWQHTMNDGEIETVWFWLNALPEDTVRKSAPLSTAYCWILWLTGQIGAIETHLVDAERALSERGVSEGVDKDNTNTDYARLPAELAAIRSFVARYHEQFEAAIVLAEHALSLIPENLPPKINAELRTLSFLALATAYDGAGDLKKAVNVYNETIRWSRLGTNAVGVAGITYRLIGALRLLGNLRAADAACHDALGYMQAKGMARLPAAGILHIAMSEVLVERNDLAAAEAHLSQGMELGKWSGRLDAAKNTANALSRLRQARHDLCGALAAVKEAEAALIEPLFPLAKAELLALEARILVRQGSVSEAAQCVEEAVHLSGQDRGQTGEMVTLAAARVMLAQSKTDEAIVNLTQPLAAADESGRWGMVIELSILRSLMLIRKGNFREAGIDLERALTLAEHDGFVRVFLEEGQPMQILIAQWLAHAKSGPIRDYAIQLFSQFDAEPNAVSTVPAKDSPNDHLAEPLSQRELEVLSLMALGRTNLEIAQLLFVARGTIKAHAASIFRKLDAANRTEAVARARQLGILP